MVTPAQGIARLGFRTWYERQLIEGHVYFVTGFLCAVLVMALLEDLNLRRPEPTSLLALAGIMLATVFGGFAMHRYLRVLCRAEMLAEQCVCPGCAVYGLVQVLDMGVVAADRHPQWISVSCRKCDRRWRMESI